MCWKLYLLCCSLLLQGSWSVPAPGHGALAGYCLVTSDCTGDNECCASFETPNGAVALDNLASGLRKFINGYCETIGTADSACL